MLCYVMLCYSKTFYHFYILKHQTAWKICKEMSPIILPCLYLFIFQIIATVKIRKKRGNCTSQKASRKSTSVDSGLSLYGTFADNL